MNYSDWFKVDLHIHTDYSKKTKTNDYQGNFDVDVLKKKLIENDVKLFSMTDHNIINVEAYKRYISNFKDGDPKLLIGCEFDIEVPESHKTITYHSVIIFENDSVEDVELISKKIEDLYARKSSVITDRKITIDELYELFNSYNFFFIPHAGNTKSILDPYKGYDMKLCQQMVLLMPSAFEKVKEAVRQHYNEGFDLLKTFDFQERDDIPYINFSDNHNCYKYPCTNKDGDNHEFYCIKGQPTFESIRFAFIDPKSRIKKYCDVEVLKRSDNYIHSLQLDNHSIINNTTLNFSPNLNVIIGGRSSGKSLLFNILGSKIGNAKNELDKKYKLDTSEIKIKSFLDVNYKDTISYNPHEVIYINQGDIVNYFENNSLIELIKESGKEEDYRTALVFFKGEKNNLYQLIEKLIDLYGELIDNLNSNYVLYNKDIEAIFDSSYFIKQIISLENKNISFNISNKILENLLNGIEDFKNNENWKLENTELELTNKFLELVQLKKREFESVTEVYCKKIDLINQTNETITAKNANLNLKSREKEASNQRLVNLNSNINSLFNLLNRFQAHCLLIEEYRYNFSKSVQISNNVDVVLELENIENVKDKILEGLVLNNSSKSLYNTLLDLAKDKIKIKNLNPNSVENFRKKINTQLKQIFEYFDKPIEFLKYSEGGSSKNNSPGYNSEKYLETILKNGNAKIIFIDQPEDNLGNRFITDNLIDIIRELKFQKQIFLVTHNPSIVVYGDAENIIMCNNDERKITYQQFVLEDKTHQKEICEVLDGGHYIFDQRSRKYNIKKLLQS
ncbi:PHP domain-containing protein [Myroides odoratimimus]|uniref:PHP domain-containing protein n=1 Tax=Myroides TaxID=76831 RepID=UPI0015FD4590|nr:MULTISPECIES: PHP domain-containing protein [Myroides]MBB1149684.1 hypothetical protein [Myroides sp. NP-2]MEC4077534.1 PHP domain-containing protein [Myroides odoratimimus]